MQKRHLRYDPVKDKEQKITELREVYNALQREKFDEKTNSDALGVDLDEASYVTPDVVRYFEAERNVAGANSDREKTHMY